ncbi:hypothetical protein [Streptosporangium roseum]
MQKTAKPVSVESRNNSAAPPCPPPALCRRRSAGTARVSAWTFMPASVRA